MAVAPSFQMLQILCDPYIVNGRMYVDVKTNKGTPRQVRWYSEKEYAKAYGNKMVEKKVFKTQKELLGFKNGYITIFKGNTYPHKDWFKENGARFTRVFNWSFGSDVEWPEDELPEGLEPIQIPWEAVSTGETLNSDEEIKEYIDSLMYEPSNSEFVGEIGDRIEEVLTVTKAITLNGYYGTSTMHIMEDANENVFVWTTAAKSFPEGKTMTLRGTIKDHKVYKGVNQTILTRCKEIING